MKLDAVDSVHWGAGIEANDAERERERERFWVLVLTELETMALKSRVNL